MRGVGCSSIASLEKEKGNSTFHSHYLKSRVSHNLHFNLSVAVFFGFGTTLESSSVWFVLSGPSGLTLP